MVTDTTENLIIVTLAKGSAAELRLLANRCEDKETALTIYRELIQIAKKLREKHKLSSKPNPK